MGWKPITHCRGCGDAFDVYHAPDERVCDNCKETDDMTMQCPDCLGLDHGITPCTPETAKRGNEWKRVPESPYEQDNRLASCIEMMPGIMAKPTMPSRDFLVRQAVLNAMKEEMPFTLEQQGSAYLGRYILELPAKLDVSGPVPIRWVYLVTAQFRKLVAQHGGTTCLAN
jgi:hypothetical protein